MASSSRERLLPDPDPDRPADDDTSLLDRVPVSHDSYAALEKKLVRRIDWALMPVLIAMIVLNYLDRNALPYARVQGIERDLNLRGDQFNVCISVLFAGYLTLQVPSNLVLTRARPSVYLPGCMMLWGAVSACAGLARSFTGLVACRALLGVVEAPFFPGALLLLSSWYTPREMATRTAVMYTGSLLAGGFGGVMAAGVQYALDGRAGLHAWQWMFLLEGGLTVVVSLASIRILPDFPTTTAWLSVEEKAVAAHRLRVQSGTVDDGKRSSLAVGLRMALLDYKVWLLTLIVLLKTSAGAVTAFVPTLVAGFRLGTVESLLMTAPPYVFAAVVAMAVSVSSDRTADRFWHLVVPLFFGLVGFVVAASARALAPRYFSLFLMLGGVYGSFDITYAWLSSTIPRPLEKRSAAFAIANMVGNVAQVYSPYLYKKSSGPQYLPAMIANALFVLGSVVFAVILLFCLMWENHKLAEAEEQQAAALPGPAADADAVRDGVDDIVERRLEGSVTLKRGFRYML